MTTDSLPPDEVLESVKVIQKLKAKTYLSREEKADLNRAKLHVAYWACRQENVVASRDNLVYVLGSDAEEIMAAYDKYLVTAEERERREKERAKAEKERKSKGSKGGTQFWGGA